MPVTLRPARPEDAAAMAALLNRIIRAGGTTAHRRPFDAGAIDAAFLSPKLGISCVVATGPGGLLGFQALEWCDPDWPGEDPLPADWAVVATYVDAAARRTGVGRALFAETLAAARAAGVRFIDATIRSGNRTGQAYYHGLGFRDYRAGADTVSKRLAPG